MARKQKRKIVSKKRAQPRATKVEIVVRTAAMVQPTEKDLTPMVDGGKYMIPRTWMSEKQVVRMVQRTPPQHVYRRQGKGGKIFDYVTGNYVEKVLNFVFGWNWDFEIVEHGVMGDFLWVHGKLTVKDDKGHSITKSQFGRKEIAYKKETAHKPENMLDFGNDLKAAATDALKKCASLLGVASDIYGKGEFKEETGGDVPPSNTPAPNTPQLPAPQTAPQDDIDLLCHGVAKSGCGNDLTREVYDYSKKVYGKPLCRECQKQAKPIRK